MPTWNSLGSADAAAKVWANWTAEVPAKATQCRLNVWGPLDVYGQFTDNGHYHQTFQGRGYHSVPVPGGVAFSVTANCQSNIGDHGVEIQAYY